EDRVSTKIAVDRTTLVIEEVPALRRVPDQAALGRQHDLVPASPDRLSDDLFGEALPVGRRCVDQGDALVQRGLDGGNRLTLIGAAPHPAADGPGAEADCGSADAGAANLSGQHFVCL